MWIPGARVWIFLALAVVAWSFGGAAESDGAQKLLADDGEPDHYFGFAVDIDDGVAVIGARGHRRWGERTGAAYVFRKGADGWTQETLLLAPDGNAGKEFGFSVATDGTTIVAGSPYDEDNGPYSGSAWVHRRVDGTWTPVAKLLPEDGMPFDLFGGTVDVDGGTVVVGADQYDGALRDQGAVYVFSNSSGDWSQEAILVAPDPTDLKSFGSAVVLDGDSLAIGAPGDGDLGRDAGAVYVFHRTGTEWTMENKLLASDGAASHSFGADLALDDDYLAVRATRVRGPGSGRGAIYVFHRENGEWTEQAKLSPGSSSWNAYGRSVDLVQDRLLVGSPCDAVSGNCTGAAELFRRSGDFWESTEMLFPFDGAALDNFGWSVALDAHEAIIGSLRDDDRGAQSGSAYVFGLACEIEVALDVKPDSPDNPVRPEGRGVLPVAILGRPGFDVTSLDASSLRLGTMEAPPAHSIDDPSVLLDHLSDVDDDGQLDLVLHFRPIDAGIDCDDTEVTIVGDNLDGCRVFGTDGIRPVGRCD